LTHISNHNIKAARGAFWNYIQQFGTLAIQFVVAIILARLLEPAEFGLIGMLTIFIQIANILIQGGLTQSLIRSKSIDDSDLSTVFYFNLAASSLMYLVIYILAPWVAIFYDQAILVPLLRVLALTFVINSFSVVQITILTKELNFKKQSIITLIAVILSASFAIYTAQHGWGVWSLVLQQVMASIFLGILFWVSSQWRPSLFFSKEKFKEHFNFGYRLTISGLLNVIFNNLYLIVIGKVFAPAALGYYTQAHKLRDLPLNTISSTLNKITFPYFSKLENDVELKERLRQVIRITLFISSPILILLAMLAPEFLQVLLSSKWLPAAPYLSLLCLAGLLYPINAFMLNILLVKGKSEKFLKLEVIKKVLIAFSILLTFKHGIIALIIGKIVLMLIVTPLNGYYLHALIDYNFKEQLSDLIAFTIPATALGVILYYIKMHYSIATDNISILFIFGVLYTFLYLLIVRFIKPSIFALTMQLLKTIKK